MIKLNHYYAEMLDVSSDNEIKTYGYVFKDKNIRKARLHAEEKARDMGIVPLATVWRISRGNYDYLAPLFQSPKRHSTTFFEEGGHAAE